MAPESNELRVVNVTTGDEFTSWTSAIISSSFLTPCDTFALESGAETKAIDLARKMAPGSFVQIFVDGRPQLTGYVDACRLSSSRGGSKVSITGRDILSPLVDGSINPRMQRPQQPTMSELLELVCTEQYGLPFTFFPNDESRDKAVGRPVGSKVKYESRHAREKRLRDIQPHANEGAFQYLARILTLHGYWMWACKDGSGVVVAGPDYDQKPAYTFVNRYSLSGGGNGNNVIEATFSHDETDVPSNVWCRGFQGDGGNTIGVEGMYEMPTISRFKPVYIEDRDATSKEQAERIARTFLARKQRNLYTYEITVRGFSDAFGAVYNIDTVANVQDECCGVDGRMWVESRSFRKDRSGGTTTQLKLIPLGTLVLDWQPQESIFGAKLYSEAAGEAGSEAPVKTGNFSAQDVNFLKPN